MSGERRLAILMVWIASCLIVIVTGPWNKWVDFIAVIGIFAAFIVIILVLQGVAIGIVTRNIKREWENDQR